MGLDICVVKIGVLGEELGLRLLRVRFWIGNLMKVCLLVERVLSCILGLRRFLGLLCIDRHRLHLALVLDICFRDRNGWLVEEHWYRYLVFERIKTRIRSDFFSLSYRQVGIHFGLRHTRFLSYFHQHRHICKTRNLLNFKVYGLKRSPPTRIFHGPLRWLVSFLFWMSHQPPHNRMNKIRPHCVC